MTLLQEDLSFQELFFIPQGCYLFSHSIGALPKASENAIQEYLKDWKSLGGKAWPKWLGVIEEFCSQIALVLQEPNSDLICPQSSVSSGLVKLLGSLPHNGRHKILCSEFDFPSLGFVLQQSKQFQVELIKPKNGVFVTLEEWNAKLDSSVALALLSHVQYGNSFQNSVSEFVSLCRAEGVVSVVDVAQSVGIVSTPVRQWNADCVLGSCVKWLCGGPGAGFMWVNPDLLPQLCPSDVGWFSHTEPFEFKISEFRYAKSAKKFWGGTPSVQPFYVAQSSLKVLNEIGFETIREHNKSLTDFFIVQGRLRGMELPFEASFPRGGTVTLNLGSHTPFYLSHLAAAEVHVDARPGFGIRFSPHIYNSKRDIEHAFSVIDSGLNAQV